MTFCVRPLHLLGPLFYPHVTFFEGMALTLPKPVHFSYYVMNGEAPVRRQFSVCGLASFERCDQDRFTGLVPAASGGCRPLVVVQRWSGRLRKLPRSDLLRATSSRQGRPFLSSKGSRHFVLTAQPSLACAVPCFPCVHSWPLSALRSRSRQKANALIGKISFRSVSQG